MTDISLQTPLGPAWEPSGGSFLAQEPSRCPPGALQELSRRVPGKL